MALTFQEHRWNIIFIVALICGMVFPRACKSAEF